MSGNAKDLSGEEALTVGNAMGLSRNAMVSSGERALTSGNAMVLSGEAMVLETLGGRNQR